jgi:septal ring factor EnvC (AmiA/AmiB activator)
MKYMKVDGHPGLYRDKETGAIVNKDDSAYNEFKTSRQLRKQKEQNMNDEINSIKNEISEIKSLLKEFLNGSR